MISWLLRLVLVTQESQNGRPDPIVLSDWAADKVDPKTRRESQAMAEELSGKVLSQRLSTVREHIRLENAHDLAAVMETFGSAPSYHDEPWDEHHSGREAVRWYYEELLRVLPDLHIEVRQEHASLDAVIVECVIRGTHKSTWRGLPTERRLGSAM
jgi:steroid delta-isomerase-like uncharacterized protein